MLSLLSSSSIVATVLAGLFQFGDVSLLQSSLQLSVVSQESLPHFSSTASMKSNSDVFLRFRQSTSSMRFIIAAAHAFHTLGTYEISLLLCSSLIQSLSYLKMSLSQSHLTVDSEAFHDQREIESGRQVRAPMIPSTFEQVYSSTGSYNMKGFYKDLLDRLDEQKEAIRKVEQNSAKSVMVNSFTSSVYMHG